MSAATDADVTEEGVACPACGESHPWSKFESEGGCPDCDRTIAELNAIAQGGSA